MPLYSPGRRRAIVLLVLTSVLLLTIDLRGSALLDASRSVWQQALRPFESAAEVVARPLRNAWRGVTEYDELVDENRRLRNEVDANYYAEIQARAILAQYQELARVSGIETIEDYDYVTAGVQGPSPSNVEQVIEIDKGRDDGVRVGMPVIDSAGWVIGKVTTPVTRDRSRVMLLTDQRYGLGVKIVGLADDLPSPQFPTTTSTTTTTTTEPDDSVAGSLPDGAATTTATTTSTTTTSTTTTTTPPTSEPVGSGPDLEGTTTSTTTTTQPRRQERETGLLEGQGAGLYPEIRLVADTPSVGGGTPRVGDAVLTTGGSYELAPPNVLVGIVAEVNQGGPSEGLILHVRPFASLDNLDFVHVVLYRPESEAPGASG